MSEATCDCMRCKADRYDAISKLNHHRAKEIERLRNAMLEAVELLIERKYGNPARSAGHNARLCLESALRIPVGGSLTSSPEAGK